MSSDETQRRRKTLIESQPPRAPDPSPFHSPEPMLAEKPVQEVKQDSQLASVPEIRTGFDFDRLPLTRVVALMGTLRHCRGRAAGLIQ